MRNGSFILRENRALTESVHLLRLEGDTSAIQKPGEFVQVSVTGKFLRRPFSVSDWDEGWLSLIVEQVGSGTELLHALPVGTEVDLLTGLGHGFDPVPGKALLIGGGTGLSPLVGLARRVSGASVLLAFRDLSQAFGEELFPGCEVRVTEDLWGEIGKIPHDTFYACGSRSMMRELCRRDPADGQTAFDLRLGCGFGACMGCTVQTIHGPRRFCKDGPVFRKGELVWED